MSERPTVDASTPLVMAPAWTCVRKLQRGQAQTHKASTMNLPSYIASRIVRTPAPACWEWRGAVGANGYGMVSVGGTMRYVHRVVYEAQRGAIAEGMVIDHLCRNRACCNPDHLEVVTSAENTRRGVSFWGTRTHCANGHAFTEENTRLRATGARVCRQCLRDAKRRGRERRRAGVAQ